MEVVTSDGDAIESLLRSFDLICQEQRDAVTEIRDLKLRLNVEKKSCEALQIDCDDLRKDNERLRNLNFESLAKLANQFERHTKCQSLKKELKEASDKLILIEEKRENANKKLKEEHKQEIEELQKQLRCYILNQSTNKATITTLQKDLACKVAEIDNLKDSFKQVSADVESRYCSEIQELREWLTVEQEEKNVLYKRLQNVESELLDYKAKQMEQQQESISLRHVEMLKQKMMKLRQENENLKRKLAATFSPTRQGSTDGVSIYHEHKDKCVDSNHAITIFCELPSNCSANIGRYCSVLNLHYPLENVVQDVLDWTNSPSRLGSDD